MSKINDFIGDKDFLNLKKTAFLCSRQIPSSAVLKCYDWAIEQRKKGNCIISGFHSNLEKDVFHYLAKGEQPIIMALPRGLKTSLDPELKNLLEKNRLLIVTPFESDVKRITKKTAAIRNQLMVEIADEIVVGYKNPNGKIDGLIDSLNIKKPVSYLVEN
jgi:hypothetical protein